MKKSVKGQYRQSKILPGVDIVFKQHPALATVGTQEQYSEYVSSIFPDSKVKDIVYHGSEVNFLNEGFKPMKPNFDTLNSIEGIYNFTTNRNFASRYGRFVYAVVLDVKRPILGRTSGEYVDDMDRPLSEALFKIGKLKSSDPFSPAYDESLVNTNAVINTVVGDGYVEISGDEWGIPPQTFIAVFDPAQIHILGSAEDIESFRSWLGN